MTLREHVAVWKRAFGLWRCSRGHHAPVVWKKNDKRNPPRFREGGPTEMMAAAGLFSLAMFLGWCSRCGEMREWASFDPRKEVYVKPGMTVAVRYTGIAVVVLTCIALAAVLL